MVQRLAPANAYSIHVDSGDFHSVPGANIYPRLNPESVTSIIHIRHDVASDMIAAHLRANVDMCGHLRAFGEGSNQLPGSINASPVSHTIFF